MNDVKLKNLAGVDVDYPNTRVFIRDAQGVFNEFVQPQGSAIFISNGDYDVSNLKMVTVSVVTNIGNLTSARGVSF